jgi:hypothetical protein
VDVGIAVKVAMTVCVALMVTVQVPVPVQAPVQPVKLEATSGNAVKLMIADFVRVVLQVDPQLIPAGSLEIIPVPEPVLFTTSVSGGVTGVGQATNIALRPIPMNHFFILPPWVLQLLYVKCTMKYCDYNFGNSKIRVRSKSVPILEFPPHRFVVLLDTRL